MSGPQVVVLVVSIVASTALVMVGLVVWLTRKAAASRAALASDLAFEPAVRGPERGTYRGSTGGYPRVAGTGSIALTHNDLLFRKMTGGSVVVPLADISGVRLSKTFNRSRVGGQLCLVVEARSGDLGYLVDDPDSWREAIARAAPQLSGHQW